LVSLPDSLRTRTRLLHTQLERGPLMRSLLRGQMDRAAYCALLRNLHVIYAALEPALQRHAAHRWVAPLYFPAMFRSHALAEDLVVLHGAGWRADIEPASAAQQYAEHLREVAERRAGLLVAHAYVRYLGDLSGGQMLKRVVATSLGLADGRGTRFYEFGTAAEVAALAAAFRAGLAALTDDALEVEAIVAEAIESFQMHHRLFDALAQPDPAGPQAAAAVSPVG
jgi:heme oxygenase